MVVPVLDRDIAVTLVAGDGDGAWIRIVVAPHHPVILLAKAGWQGLWQHLLAIGGGLGLGRPLIRCVGGVTLHHLAESWHVSAHGLTLCYVLLLVVGLLLLLVLLHAGATLHLVLLLLRLIVLHLGLLLHARVSAPVLRLLGAL